MDDSTVTLKPRPWYLVAMAGGTAVVSSVLALLSFGGVQTIVCAAIGAPLGVCSAGKLEVSAEGVRAFRRSARWDELEVRKSRWGQSLRRDGPFADRINVLLSSYEKDWRTGVIGEHAHRHAPHLLEP